MNLSIVPRPQRIIAITILVLDLLILGSHLLSPSLEITTASIQVGKTNQIPFQRSPAPPGTNLSPAPEQPSQFLAGNFTVHINKRLSGQRLRFNRIVISSEKGKRIASLKIELVDRRLKAVVTFAGGKPTTTETLEKVVGPVTLYPFEQGDVTFGVAKAGSVSIFQGQTVIVRVEGRRGLRGFHVDKKVKPLVAPG